MARYSERYSIRAFRIARDPLPPEREQDAVSRLAARIDEIGPDRFADEVLRNKCRTSTRSGILKSLALLRFCGALSAHGIEYLQDLSQAVADKGLEADIRQIPPIE